MSAIGTMDSVALEARMRALLGRGRQAEVDFLLHLMEFDRRRGYEILGYVRLWDYCRKELRFLEGASWRRMRTIGILRKFPVAEEYLRDGRLSMTGLVTLEAALTADNCDELLGKAACRSKKEIEYLVACHRAPVTLGTASIRKAPAPRASERDPHTDPATGADPGSEIAVVDERNETPAPATPLAFAEDEVPPTTATPTPSASPILAPTPSPISEPRPTRTGSVEALSADCFRVKMTVTKDFVDALEKVQKILGHTVSRTDIAGALKAGLDVILARDAKRKTPKAKQAAAQRGARAPRARRVRSATKAARAETANTNATCADEACLDATGVDATGANAACVNAARANAAGLDANCADATGAGTTGAGANTTCVDAGPRKMSGSVERRAKREHIPIEVAREVWDRDGGCCVWVMASGEKCGSDEETQIDHVDPVAFGGKPTVATLRILCRGHNLLYARQCFGDAYMAKFSRSARAASAGESAT